MATNDLERIDILGTPLTVLNSYDQAVTRILDCIVRKENVSCVAVNPEKIHRAHKDKDLQEFAKGADFCICDGVGAAAAARILFGRKIPRITGIQLFFDLVACAATRKLRIFLLGGSPESNEGAYMKLKQMHSKLQITGRQHGYFTDDEAVIAQIRNSGADMLFVALGSPRQEKWLAKYRDKIDVPYCMGVGGSLDVLSGKTGWAPRLFRKTGTEWLYRLVREPRRVQRQAALPVFALSVMWRYFCAKMGPHHSSRTPVATPTKWDISNPAGAGGEKTQEDMKAVRTGYRDKKSLDGGVASKVRMRSGPREPGSLTC